MDVDEKLKVHLTTILKELSIITAISNFSGSGKFANEIVGAEKIVTVGAGRVGLSMRAFAKRLKHLGKESYFIGDDVLPKFGKNDLMIIGSGSGETASNITMAKKCKEAGSKLILVTSKPKSSIASLADLVVCIGFEEEQLERESFQSIQPMTSLFEQILFLTLDAIVLDLMDLLNVNEEQMRDRHNVFE